MAIGVAPYHVNVIPVNTKDENEMKVAKTYMKN